MATESAVQVLINRRHFDEKTSKEEEKYASSVT